MKKVVIFGISGTIARVYQQEILKQSDKFLLVAGIDLKDFADVKIPIYQNWQDFLKSGEKIDIIIICTSPSAHKKIFDEVVEYGATICIEKPPAFSLIECQEMIERAQKHKTTLFFAFHTLYSYGVAELKNALVGESIKKIDIRYSENVRDFRPLGMTDFGEGCLWDSLINAIATVFEVLPESGWHINQTDLQDTENIGTVTDAYIQVDFLNGGKVAVGTIEQHWMSRSPIVRLISITLEDGGCLELDIHGSKLSFNNSLLVGGGEIDGLAREYRGILDHLERCASASISYTPVASVKFIEDICRAHNGQ